MSKYTIIKKHAMQGFTLVELLIVVIILAILAAIVVPQFGSSTNDAKLASLNTTLANTRAAIDLFYQQHGFYPASVISTGGTCDSGTADTTGTAITTSATFLAQLSLYTDSAGHACTGTGANYKYGPYLKKNAIPSNPVNGNSGLLLTATGVLGLVSSNTTGTGGWKYDTGTGQFIADDHRLVPPSTTLYYDQL